MSSIISTTTLPCGLKVGKQGLGMMGFSAFYESARNATDSIAIEVFKQAVDSGVTLFNTADFYGPLDSSGYGHNLRLLGKCLSAPGVDRSNLQIMMKIGIDTRDGTFQHNASPSELRRTVDWALEELGVDMIDILVLNREDPVTPLEESLDALFDICKSGKARFVGLSEFSAANIRRACKRGPIACAEMEWSLMSRDIETDIIPACREHNVAIIAYAPLMRGLLSGTITSAPMDFKGASPRFSADNLPSNLALVAALAKVAGEKGVSPAQIALAWVHAQGSDVVPIPGTTNPTNLSNNLIAASIILTEGDLSAIERACPAEAVQGDRYGHMATTYHGNKDQ